MIYVGLLREFLEIWSLDLHCIFKAWYHALCFSLPNRFLAPVFWVNLLLLVCYLTLFLICTWCMCFLNFVAEVLAPFF